uniref:Uncharacterized protein n=1 Tax=Pithovirus LCPAC403 TaxID=2506596 RepID=A0A481ZB98_9VIRU|nr:MAG: hypothetical protein LCPAC403_03370 [Pithovirus LCPAC403]
MNPGYVLETLIDLIVHYKTNPSFFDIPEDEKSTTLFSIEDNTLVYMDLRQLNCQFSDEMKNFIVQCTEKKTTIPMLFKYENSFRVYNIDFDIFGNLEKIEDKYVYLTTEDDENAVMMPREGIIKEVRKRVEYHNKHKRSLLI